MILRLVISGLLLFAAAPAPPAGPDADRPGRPLAALLGDLVTIGAPSGYEGPVTEALREALPEGVTARVDSIGNLIVEGGEGAPHRLLYSSVDEPGLVVTRITEEGFLRAGALGGFGPRGGMDLRFLEGKRVLVRGGGREHPAAVITTSIHLRGNRPEKFTLDDLWIDVGASSPEEVAAAGITLLSPVTQNKEFRPLAGDRLSGTALSSRYGAAALLAVCEAWAKSPPGGKWTIAWTVQGLSGGRGVLRLAATMQPDEVYQVGGIALPAPRGDDEAPLLGHGPVLVGSAVRDAGVFAGEIRLQISKARGADPGERFPSARSGIVLGLAIENARTPGEIIDGEDLDGLVKTLTAIGRAR